MNILTVMSGLEMGGIEKTLLTCLPYLNKHGVNMDILCSKGGELDKAYEANGARIIDFGKMKGPFVDAIRLWQVLSDKKYDVVHSRLGHTSGLYAWVCKLKGVPCLVSVHNEKAMFRNNWQRKPILSSIRAAYLALHKKLTQKYATKIVGHSKANLRYFTADYLSNNKYVVLYNGIDFSKLDSNTPLIKQKQEALNQFIGNSPLTIISVGKFKEQKNHSFLIDVFATLTPQRNNYKLILLGTGSLKESIEQKVNELGLTEHVLFTGVEQNIAPYLEASDLFFFPSLYEGFGNVIIEAQYKHLPVFVSGIPPHYESTYQYYQKFFFSPVNSNEASEKMAAMIDEIMEPEKLSIVKAEAFNFAEQFSIEAMINNMIILFKSVAH